MWTWWVRRSSSAPVRRSEPGFRKIGIDIEVEPWRPSFDPARHQVLVGKVEGKEVDLARHTADHRHRLAEVRLGVARGVMQGHEHLARPKPPLTDIVLHDGVAAGEPVLVPETVEDPLRRVPRAPAGPGRVRASIVVCRFCHLDSRSSRSPRASIMGHVLAVVPGCAYMVLFLSGRWRLGVGPGGWQPLPLRDQVQVAPA